jgi:hypothetical protein
MSNETDPSGAIAAISDLKAGRDPAFAQAFANPSHAGHRAAVERLSQLHELAYGGAAGNAASGASGVPAAPSAVPGSSEPPGSGDAPRPADEIAREIDQHFPPARPEQFDLPSLADEGEDYGPRQFEADKLARSWLADARFPREIGSHIAQEAARTAALLKTMTPESRELWARGQREMIDRTLGAAAPRKLALAHQLIQELEGKSPGVVAFLEASGAGNAATIVVQVAEHATRLAARRGIRVDG